MTPPRIIAEYVSPPIPVAGWWQAHDDRMGADTSPIGTGATREEAITDLMDKLEDME